MKIQCVEVLPADRKSIGKEVENFNNKKNQDFILNELMSI